MKRLIFVLLCSALFFGCSVKPVYEEGKNLQTQKKYQGAIEKYQEVITKDPKGQYSEDAKLLLEKCKGELELSRKIDSIRLEKSPSKKSDLFSKLLLDFPDSEQSSVIASLNENAKSESKKLITDLRVEIGSAFVNCASINDLLYGTVYIGQPHKYVSADKRNVDLELNDKGEYSVVIKCVGKSLFSGWTLFEAYRFGFTWLDQRGKNIFSDGIVTISCWDGNQEKSGLPTVKINPVGIKIAQLRAEFYEIELTEAKYDDYGKKVSDKKKRARLIESYLLTKENATKVNLANIDNISKAVINQMVVYDNSTGPWFEVQ